MIEELLEKIQRSLSIEDISEREEALRKIKSDIINLILLEEKKNIKDELIMMVKNSLN
ncbi:hypothetical protein [Flavobacterium davisii]|uniref:hypothetical protein n=1 Tax=Flavobacterium davisii TaxID=2906077 RepID=UPI0013FD6FB0|nr:hypothetical protein [Flavobacterium davisii]